MKFQRIKKLGEHNVYDDVAFIPPSAKPVSGPMKVGDYVEVSDYGYIRVRYRVPDRRPSTAFDPFR